MNKTLNVVISGAASGVGRELALYYKSIGARLALIDLQKSDIDADFYFELDVRNEFELKKASDLVLSQWNSIDIVIACAGVGGVNPARTYSSDFNRKIMEINYFGNSNTLSPFIPKMIEQGYGTLVGVCSLAALRGLPFGASYSASKAAQMTWLESMRLDLRKKGVKVVSVFPGFVETPMADHQEFKMPFKVTAMKSANLIARAIRRGSRTVSFPLSMVILAKLNRFLPACIYDRLTPFLAGPEPIKPKLLTGLSNFN